MRLLLLVGLWSISTAGIAQRALPLQSLVNSPADELAPVFSLSGDTLFFVRSDHPENVGGQDIWLTIRQPNGQWGTPQHLPAPLNNASPNSVCGVGQGGALYLNNVYRSRQSMAPGVSVTQYEAPRGWVFPKKISIPGLHLVAESMEFQIVGDTLALISMPAGPSGGAEDLFVSFRDSFGDWSEPLNLGGQLNTDSAEFSPFLAADGRTLYFASTGHRGYGDADLFVATRLDDSWANWTKPQNLGPNVNSEAFEGYLAIDPAEQTMLFCRAQSHHTDLWGILLSQLHDSSPPLTAATPSPSVVPAPVVADSPPASQTVATPKGTNSLLIFFDYNTATLDDSARFEISKLVFFLRANPTQHVRLRGRTDAVGESTNNQRLAERRALAIKEELLKQGIDKQRITIAAEGSLYATVAPEAPEVSRRQDRVVVVEVSL